MRALEHPAPEAITLAGILHALADPARLAIYRSLVGKGEAASCTACVAPEMPRATRSHHFRILREAGLIRSERRGAAVLNLPRAAELEARFPGLIAAIEAAAAR